MEQAATGGGGDVLWPREPIDAHSLPVPAVAGPWLKSEQRAAVRRFVGCNWLDAWLTRLVSLNGIASAAFHSHQK